jgi:hypothetical protein
MTPAKATYGRDKEITMKDDLTLMQVLNLARKDPEARKALAGALASRDSEQLRLTVQGLSGSELSANKAAELTGGLTTMMPVQVS